MHEKGGGGGAMGEEGGDCRGMFKQVSRFSQEQR